MHWERKWQVQRVDRHCVLCLCCAQIRGGALALRNENTAIHRSVFRKNSARASWWPRCLLSHPQALCDIREKLCSD